MRVPLCSPAGGQTAVSVPAVPRTGVGSSVAQNGSALVTTATLSWERLKPQAVKTQAPLSGPQTATLPLSATVLKIQDYKDSYTCLCQLIISSYLLGEWLYFRRAGGHPAPHTQRSEWRPRRSLFVSRWALHHPLLSHTHHGRNRTEFRPWAKGTHSLSIKIRGLYSPHAHSLFC